MPRIEGWDCAMRSSYFALCACLLILPVGCAKQPPPLTAPSGEQPGYAEQYPTLLTTLRTRFAADEAKVQAALPQLEPAAAKLDKSDPATVAQLFELADAEGKSGSYANQALESDTVSRFWSEEKQPLHQKIGGAVAYAGKQKECSKECSDDLGGVAAGASDRAVEKQLEERQQRLGEVHRFVEDHEEQLTKPNMEPAEKQANAIAQLSHITRVRLELYRRELEASLNEASDVRSTLAKRERRSAGRSQSLEEPQGVGREAQGFRLRGARERGRRGRARQARARRYGAARKEAAGRLRKSLRRAHRRPRGEGQEVGPEGRAIGVSSCSSNESPCTHELSSPNQRQKYSANALAPSRSLPTLSHSPAPTRGVNRPKLKPWP
jgi:hypothetical protein